MSSAYIQSSMNRRKALGQLLAGGAAGAMVFSTAASAASGSVKAGFSSARLMRLTDGMQAYIAKGDISGALALIYRRGVLAHTDVLGWQDQEANTPLRRDTIFRIASMSKPVTAVAALILIEEGKFRLEDSVDRWLPELANRKVLRNPAGPLDDTYSSPRPITIEDLLTQRLGLASSLGGTEGPMVAALATLRQAQSVDDWLRRLSNIPLLYPPGERFIYGYGLDIMGHLIARASGISFADFLQARLFAPLGMVDTAFFVPREKLHRLCVAYEFNAATGKKAIVDSGASGRWSQPPAIPSGAGGLVSTGDDYLKFGRMLLGHGRLDGTRILSRKTIELMTSNFLTPEQRRMPFFYDGTFWRGQGYGLGVSVTDDIAGREEPSSLGQYGWNGAYGTLWFNDPKEDLSAVLMIQTAFGETAPRIQRDFRTLLYQAIDD